MGEANTEISVDTIQAISRALEIHRPLMLRRLERYKHRLVSNRANPGKKTPGPLPI